MVTGKKRGAPGMRLAPGSMLKAAEMILRGENPADVAKRFGKPPAIDELKRWAKDLKELDRTGFLARYGAKKGVRKLKASADPRVLISNTLVELKAERDSLQQRAKALEPQIASYQAALDALEKHVEG